MSKKLIIIGAGGFGREVAALVRRINRENKQELYHLLGFVDDNPALEGKLIDGFPVLGNLEWLNAQEETFCLTCAIGSSLSRKRAIEKMENKGMEFVSLIDPSAVFLGETVIGTGSIICANSIISVGTSIGKHTIVNLSCTIGHDVAVGDYCTINPGSSLSGFSKLENCVEVGTGTKIIQHIIVGENTILGAGTVVISDIASNVTAVGCPARIVKHHI